MDIRLHSLFTTHWPLVLCIRFRVWVLGAEIYDPITLSLSGPNQHLEDQNPRKNMLISEGNNSTGTLLSPIKTHTQILGRACSTDM